MTEADIVESMHSGFGLVVDVLSVYMTITSAYLLVAFLAGTRLTRSQVGIISTLYVFMAAVTTYAAFAWGMRGIHYAFELQSLGTGSPIYATQAIPVALSSTLAGGILASLKFMWDVRHPKAE